MGLLWVGFVSRSGVPGWPWPSGQWHVDWGQSYAFCAWAGGRLCSEAEWEYAARNGSAGDNYPWGDAEPSSSLTTFCTDSAPACSIPAGNNTWGVCDLAGNATEWVRDCEHVSYSGADRPDDGKAWTYGCSFFAGVFRGGGGGTCEARFFRG